jgi:hypothetical protein
MAVTVLDPHDTQALTQDASTAINDLNANNFSGAWQTALASSGMYNKPGQAGYNAAMGSATQDPLLAAMESSSGLKALDPSKQWTGAQTSQFYNAFNQQGAYHGQQIAGQGGGAESLGKNPYGNWGDASKIGGDATANIAQEGATPDIQRFAGATPTKSFLGKYGMDIAALVATVATMGAATPLLAAAIGAGTMVAGNAAAGNATTWKSAAEDAAVGALGAAVPAAGSYIGGAGGLGIGTAAGTALAGAGVGAARGAVTGGNIGMDALVGGAAAGAASAYGSGAGRVAGYAAGQAGNAAGLNNAPTGGSGGNMMSSGGNTQSPNYGSMFSGLAGMAAPILSGIGANNQASMQNNAYTTAGNAANSGNMFGTMGMNGMNTQFNNGQLNMDPGSMGGAASGFNNFAGNQLGMANAYGQGGVPQNVSQGFGNYNNQLNQSSMFNGMGQNTAAGVMGQGANMLGTANANMQGAYNTALTSGQQALNPQIQQQSNALLNSNFERGMSGTSGGALQTQALQNSFNTAELQNQSNALNTGQNIFNSTVNAGNSMFNSGAGQMGNFNNAGANYGNQGMQGAMNYNAFSPQLAGMYNNNANSATTGMGNINSMMLNNANMGLQSTANMGTQMNRGAMTQTSGANTYNGGLASYAGGVLGAPGATNNLMNGASSLFSGMSGLSNMFGNNTASSGTYGGSTSSNPANFSGTNYVDPSMSQAPVFDPNSVSMPSGF